LYFTYISAIIVRYMSIEGNPGEKQIVMSRRDFAIRRGPRVLAAAGGAAVLAACGVPMQIPTSEPVSREAPTAVLSGQVRQAEMPTAPAIKANFFPVDPATGEAVPISDKISNQGSLEVFISTSERMDGTPDGAVTWYRREVNGKGMNCVIVKLNSSARPTILLADGIVPQQAPDNSSRWWSDGRQHLEAPSSFVARNKVNSELGQLKLFVPTDYFPEGLNTFPEGPVVDASRGLYLFNDQRSGLGITHDNRPEMGYYNAEQVRRFKVVWGFGPLVVLPARDGVIKFADPNVPKGTETDDRIFWNPYNEYFSNDDYRVQNYMGGRTQGFGGYGYDSLGQPFLFIATSTQTDGNGIRGIDVAQQAVLAGVTHGGLFDSGSQPAFQWVKDDGSIDGFEQDPVPVGIAVYV
jgi:hypothetical protein